MRFALLGLLLVASLVLFGCTQPASPSATPTLAPSVSASVAPTVDASVAAEASAVDTELGDLGPLDDLTADDLDASDFDRLG